MRQIQPIKIEIPSKKDYHKPYHFMLKNLTDSLKMAVLNGNRKEIHELKIELHGLIAVIEQFDFELAMPEFARTTRDQNTLRYDKENPPKKIWTLVNGKKVEFEMKVV